MAEDDSLHDPTPYSELMTSIISRFKVEEVIQAAVNLIEYLTTLPFLIPASGLECPEIKVNLTSIDLRNLHYFVSYFVNRMFSSQDFLHGQLAQVRVVKIHLFSIEKNLRVKYIIIQKSYGRGGNSRGGSLRNFATKLFQTHRNCSFARKRREDRKILPSSEFKN